ncbi:LamG domain-containing protein, partial [bacterium]|nr:LamG domain-containing protein [bacterium]
MSLYSIISFPNDYSGYWKFDGDASDVSGRNNGTLLNGAVIASDAVRGNIVNFATAGAYAKVNNNDLLNMGTGSLSVSTWFKAGPSSGLGALVSKNPDLTNYTLFLCPDGRVLLETNGTSFYRYSKNGINYRDNNWHHVVAIFDSNVPTINLYVDGTLSNGQAMFIKGSNVKSSTSNLFIGNNNSFGQYEFFGNMDDLMIYNRALAAAEVTLVYRTQQTG